MSNKIEPPRDAIGNELLEGDLVSLIPNRHLLGKVVAVQSGGLSTNQGVQPTRVRIVIDMNLAQVPGVYFTTLAKIVNPIGQAVVEHMVTQ